jgi:esterase/lipase superfamily enzyme
MHFEARHHYSGSLGREMHFNVYGHAGKPIIIFPSSGGSHNEFADFDMIAACQPWIDRGLVRFYTPDSIDNESWLATYKSGHDMAQAHNAYDSYIVNELLALIKHENAWGGAVGVAGCSMGGYHAMNFGLRHPDAFDITIAISGVYDARFFTGDLNGSDAVYYNSPVDYLPNTNDGWWLDKYRGNAFITAVGQGAWEGPHIAETARMQQIFADKGIPGWFDFWGHDMPHDWSTWRDMMPYFLGKLEEAQKI